MHVNNSLNALVEIYYNWKIMLHFELSKFVVQFNTKISQGSAALQQ